MEYNVSKYRRTNLKEEPYPIKYLLILMILGSVLGSIFINYNIENFQRIYSFIDISINDSKDDTLFNYMYFFEIFLKNIKYFIAIWFLGFIPIGNIFIWILLFIKGFSIGFTTSFFLNRYYISGLKYILSTYAIQNVIIIPFMLYIAFKAIKYYNEKPNKEEKLINYFKVFVICLCINIMLSIYIYFI